MHIDFKLLESFALIMRVGSLTKAEALSGISKATLSRQLQRLEEQLGAQLLVRSARKIIPTDAGHAFNAHCESLLTEMTARVEAASTEVQDMTSGVKGKLVILSDSQFSTTFVSHVTRTFMRRHPNLECELYMAGRADSPSVDEVDCYVCDQALDLPNLIAKPVGRLKYGLYASPIYLRRAGVPMSRKT